MHTTLTDLVHMDEYYETVVDKSLDDVNFTSRDFITSMRPGRGVDKGSPNISTHDVREVLLIHAKNLCGENDRKKSTERKVSYTEQFLTSTGSKKLSDARNIIRVNLHEESVRRERLDENPVCSWETHHVREMGEMQGETRSDINTFIKTMQSWGKYPQNDRKYYLHMVSRYYLRKYHTSMSDAGIVLESPSYQYILDTVDPNGCDTRFPSEFRRFLVDTEGRSFKTANIPVPVKGSGTEVRYDVNFELIPEVASMRRKITSIFRRWRDEGLEKRTSIVYPKFLLVGDEGNTSILEAVSRAETCKLIRKSLPRMEGMCERKLSATLQRHPKMGRLYEEYTKTIFRTHGEQLRERFGFFVMTCVRSMFVTFKNEGVMDELFENNRGIGMEKYSPMDNFCTSGRSLVTIERDEDVCRSLLMILVDVSFLFYVFKNKGLAQDDPSVIIKKGIDGALGNKDG